MNKSLSFKFMLVSTFTIGIYTTKIIQAEELQETNIVESSTSPEAHAKLSFFGDDQALQKLKYGRICFFDTRGSYPFVRILENDMARVTTFQLKKDLNKMQVVHQWIHNFADWTLTKKAYKGKAKSYIGKTLEAVVNSHYKGKILADQYKAGYPFCFKLNSMKEFSTIIKYLMEEGVTPNETKNTLFVTSEEPFDTNKLTQGEISFVNRYFTIQDAINDEASLALCKSLKATLQLCADVNNGSGVIPLYGNQPETVVALLNKEFYNFEGDICLPIAIKVVVAGCLIGAVLKYGQDLLAQKVTDPLKNKKAPEKQMSMEETLDNVLKRYIKELPKEVPVI